MMLWVIIIFLMGLLLTFGQDFIMMNDMVWKSGLIVTLISLGIIMRMFRLSKGGQREKLLNRIAELEAQVAQVKQ